MEQVVVDADGRILLPANVRQHLRLQPESVLTVRLEGERLVLQRADSTSAVEEPLVQEIGGVLVVDADIAGDPRTIVERMRQERLDHLAGL
jgi:bifunctional DNA-binding transcriptional regulator/antitoxin component of YhaV-PrlF toxin-antitoxin module